MKGLLPLWHAWQRAYYRWARHELSKHKPMHPDLPMVIARVAELEASYGANH